MLRTGRPSTPPCPASGGPIQQTPPAYSAIKVAGRRAYALARAGQAPELKPRTVTIDRIEVLEWDGSDPQRPIATIEVDCSAGTYIRSLARDLGAAVGSAAYLGALVRTASGPFHLDAAHPVDVVREAATAGPDRLAALVLPPDTGLERFPKVVLDEAEVRAVGLGQFIRPHEPLTAVPGADRPVPPRRRSGSPGRDRGLAGRPDRAGQGPRRRSAR